MERDTRNPTTAGQHAPAELNTRLQQPEKRVTAEVLPGIQVKPESAEAVAKIIGVILWSPANQAEKSEKPFADLKREFTDPKSAGRAAFNDALGLAPDQNVNVEFFSTLNATVGGKTIYTFTATAQDQQSGARIGKLVVTMEAGQSHMKVVAGETTQYFARANSFEGRLETALASGGREDLQRFFEKRKEDIQKSKSNFQEPELKSDKGLGKVLRNETAELLKQYGIPEDRIKELTKKGTFTFQEVPEPTGGSYIYISLKHEGQKVVDLVINPAPRRNRLLQVRGGGTTLSSWSE